MTPLPSSCHTLIYLYFPRQARRTLKTPRSDAKILARELLNADRNHATHLTRWNRLSGARTKIQVYLAGFIVVTNAINQRGNAQIFVIDAPVKKWSLCGLFFI